MSAGKGACITSFICEAGDGGCRGGWVYLSLLQKENVCGLFFYIFFKPRTLVCQAALLTTIPQGHVRLQLRYRWGHLVTGH